MFIPSVSYGVVPVVGSMRRRAYAPGVIRDVTGSGGGAYDLAFQNNRNATDPGFQITFTATADSATPITSVTVPNADSVLSCASRPMARRSRLIRKNSWYVTRRRVHRGRACGCLSTIARRAADIPNITSPVQSPPEIRAARSGRLRLRRRHQRQLPSALELHRAERRSVADRLPHPGSDADQHRVLRQCG